MATILSIYHVPGTSPLLSWYYFVPFYNKKAEVLVVVEGVVKYLVHTPRSKSRGEFWIQLSAFQIHGLELAGSHSLLRRNCGLCCSLGPLATLGGGLKLDMVGIFTPWKLANTTSQELPPRAYWPCSTSLHLLFSNVTDCLSQTFSQFWSFIFFNPLDSCHSRIRRREPWWLNSVGCY